MSDIRVALIEDHDVLRIGLRTVLQRAEGIGVVGEAADGLQGLALLKTTQIDVVLMDITLPGMDGIELTQKLRHFQREQPEMTAKVIILTMLGNADAVLASFAAGADSYCMKDIGSEQLIAAIRTTHRGNPFIDPAVASVVLWQMRQCMLQPAIPAHMIEIRSVEPKYKKLMASDPVTDRERAVLELMVAGCTNVVIAGRLCITVGTVKTHVRNILAKLFADDRTEAAVRALRSGIIS
jgi:DNA-binding NarL/FixJ family response regulator